MIYIAVFLFLASAAMMDIVTVPNTVRSITLILIFLGLVGIAGMRWEIGPDWESYHTFFIDYEQYRDGVYINMLEPGYTWLNGFVRMFSTDYTAFLVFIALLTIGLKYIVFLRHSKIIFVVIFFYYCYYLADIASVRQFTSLSITLFSSIFIVKRRPWLFAICVIIATSIHISSIAFLGAYWIYHKEFSNKTLAILLVLSFIAGFLNISGLVLGKAIGLLGSSSIYAEKLLKYSDSGVDSSNGNPYLNFLLGALKRAVIVPVILYYRDKVNIIYNGQYKGYLNLLVVGNILYFLFIISFPEITRLSVSYLYFEIFLLGYVLISIGDKPLKVTAFVLLILFGAFRLYSFMAPFLELYTPYQTFLSY
jgi:hypothetical protein